jgi:acyl dehydratase
MTELPGWSIDITPTFVVSTALATRDFQDVHHDKARAIELGSKDIFVNILTSQGLVQRYITDSLGHDIEIRSIDIRLGAPAHPGDTLTFSGTVEDETDGVLTLRVRGDVALGAHITGTVVVKR